MIIRIFHKQNKSRRPFVKHIIVNGDSLSRVVWLSLSRHRQFSFPAHRFRTVILRCREHLNHDERWPSLLPYEMRKKPVSNGKNQQKSSWTSLNDTIITRITEKTCMNETNDLFRRPQISNELGRPTRTCNVHCELFDYQSSCPQRWTYRGVCLAFPRVRKNYTFNDVRFVNILKTLLNTARTSRVHTVVVFPQ